MISKLTRIRILILALLFGSMSLVSCRQANSQVASKQMAIVQEEPGQWTKDIDLPLPLTDKAEQLLYRKAYVVSYNKDTRQPNWVAWHLTAQHADGDVPRPGAAWHEDMEVPAPRAYHADYRNTGWDRGHMCPAGDNKWDETAMYESFLMTNACPQHKNLNSSDWNEIEQSCRGWAKKYGDIYIVCGPIFMNQKHDTIGYNRIPVPEAFFKVIACLNPDNPKGIGFICRNTEGNRKKDFYVNSISQVERITGMTFFPNLPEDLSSKVKTTSDLSEW